MDKIQLRELVAETLHELNLYSVEAENLIMGTIAQESRLGYYIKQLGDGPALGICQMETATHDDIWENYLKYKPALVDRIINYTSKANPNARELRWNLKYAIAMCRVLYIRKPGTIPFSLKGQAEYWKKHYNTYLGAGTVEEYINNYNKYVK